MRGHETRFGGFGEFGEGGVGQSAGRLKRASIMQCYATICKLPSEYVVQLPNQD